MEKKNKKKLFAIIGGSVLAFVLTIALSVSITLAYFGETKNDTTTITLGAAVTLDSVALATAEAVTLVPTQKADLTTTITGPATTTESYLFIEVVTDVTKGSGNATEEDLTAIKNALNTAISTAVGSDWEKVCDTTNGTLYAFGSADDLQELGAGALEQTFAASFNIPDLTNSAALAEVTFTVKAVRIQQIFADNGTTPKTAASDYQDIVLGTSFLNTAVKTA